MKETQEIPEWRVIADEVWAMLRESQKKFDAQKEENDRAFRELRENQEKSREENARAFQELRENLEKSRKETDRQLKETDRQLKETDRQLKETDRQLKETGKQLKETDKRLGKLGNRFGEMIEHMIIPNLIAKFKELGFTFTKANRTEIEDEENNIFAEVDALLENGDKVMAVEIKSKPKTEDIDDHLERMEKLRRYADLHNDGRAYLGALAGVVFSKSEKIYALKKGLYVIEPSGDTFNIIEPKGAYHPREWLAQRFALS